MKERENNYDLLRILSCIGVIVIHAVSRFPGRDSGGVWSDELDFIGGLVRYSVPCFLMLSGKFLLSNSKDNEYDYFVKKSFSKLIPPILIISVVGVCYSELNGMLLHTGNKLDPFINWLEGRPFYHLWYVYTLIGIYLIVPAIVHVRASVSKKIYKLIGVSWLLASCISCLFCDFQLAWGVHTIGCFASWLVIGDLIGNTKKRRNPWICFVVAGAMLFLTGIWETCQNYLAEGTLQGKILGYINASNNFSPTVVLASVAIFTGFKNLNVGFNCYKTSEKTFLIYLVHAFVLDVMVKAYNIFDGGTPNAWIWIPLCTGIVFILSYCCAFPFDKIVQVLKNKFSNNCERV